MKNRITQLKQKKETGEKITMLTCYDATFAKILDEAGVDILLVGDSLGMVIQGYETTLPVTLDEMIYHTRCVSSSAQNASVVVDLPFMSYQSSIETAMQSAGRCLKETKAQAVKLEGGEEMSETIFHLTRSGIPVMGHIGIQPQSIHQMGGYKIQGKEQNVAQKLLKSARCLEDAGCFAIVLEGILPLTAATITKKVSTPTIGIASGPHCDGQVLVLYDLLGLHRGWQPKFVKPYLDGNHLVIEAVRKFMKEVQTKTFASKKAKEDQEPSPLQ